MSRGHELVQVRLEICLFVDTDHAGHIARPFPGAEHVQVVRALVERLLVPKASDTRQSGRGAAPAAATVGPVGAGAEMVSLGRGVGVTETQFTANDLEFFWGEINVNRPELS